jgi:hypothetical protein
VGILRPPTYTLMGVLPFMALGWLCVGAITAGFLRTRRPAAFKTLRRVFMTHFTAHPLWVTGPT